MTNKSNCITNTKWAKAGLLHNQLVDTQITYSESPVGRLSVEQILNGEHSAIWETSNPGMALVKKKIIITDWFYAQDLSSNEDTVALYQMLLEEGFLLYVWNHNELILIQSIHALYGALIAVTPATPSLLQNEMKRLDISHDAAYFADVEGSHCLIKALINPDFKKTLCWNTLQNLSKDCLADLFESLPRLTSTVFQFDANDLNGNGFLDTWCKNIPSIRFALDFARHSTWVEVQLILQRCHSLKHINLNFFRNLGEFPKQVVFPTYLESLCLYSIRPPLQWLDVKKIVKESPNLKSLGLQRAVTRDALIQDLAFPASLESLDCEDLNITWVDLQQMIKKCCNLKSLKLRDCSNLGKLPQGLLFPASLESVDFPDITWKVIHNLSIDCPNLKSLSIHEKKREELPKDVVLPVSLESFACSQTDITWSEILQLIATCPRLTLLELQYCDNLGQSLQNPRVSVALESIKITSDEDIWDVMEEIIKGCPNLKSLNLFMRQNLGKLSPNVMFPPLLESLECYQLNITWRQIQNLVHLKRLSLQEMAVLGELPQNMVFPALRSLMFDSTHLPMKDVQSIIQNSPNLKSLELRTWGKAMDNNLDALSGGVVSNALESLQCSVHSLREVLLLQDLLKNCPNVKSLTLRFATKLDSVSEDFPFHPSLKKIDCSITDITWKSVQIIIKKCPNLTSINLQGCYKLGDLPEDLILPYGLKLDMDASNTQAPFFIFDTNTELSNGTLDVRVLFKPKTKGTVIPNDYRISIYTQIDGLSKIISQLPKAFLEDENKTYPSASLIESLYDNTLAEDPTCFLGRIVFDKGVQDWMPLPSLSPNDVIDPSQIQLEPPADFSLAFCKEEGMYYIKPKHPLQSHTTLTFILTIKDSATCIPPITISKAQRKSLSALQFNAEGKLSLDKEVLSWLTKDNCLQALIAYCSSFKAKKLSDNRGEAYPLNQVIRERAGHCRHRAHAFMALAFELGIDCRYVKNDCHAYVEVLQANQWIRIDLGGSPSILKIKPFIEGARDNRNFFKEECRVQLSIDHNNPFNTWDTYPSNSKTLAEYIDELLTIGKTLSKGKKNILCTLDVKQIDGLHKTLLEQTKKDKHSLFFMSDLNQVPLQQIVVDNDSGRYSKKDSVLSSFIKTAKEGDVLLVNWSDYGVQHVGFNTLMDKERQFKNNAIPQGVRVISLLSHDKKAEMGEDFYSRCRVVSSMPSHLTANVSSIPELPSDFISEVTEICFYDDDWRSALTGTIELTPKGYALTESPFVTALKEKKPAVVLRNAPWHLPSFRYFMDTMQSQGEILVNGEPQALNGVRLYRDDRPYDLKDAPLVSGDCERIDVVLNTTTYHAFFQQYRVEENKLIVQPGFAQQHANKTIHILLTSTLTNGQWAKLFTYAKKHQVLISLSIAPNVEIPKQLDAEKVTRTNKIQSTQLVQCTNDIGYSIEDSKQDLIIPISEKTSLADLIETISTTGEQESLRFHHQLGALSKALLQGRQVILAGTPSKALTEGLASLFLPQPYLLLNGRCESFKGSIRLMSETVKGLDFVDVLTQEVTQDMCWEALAKKHDGYAIETLKKVCDAFIKASKHPAFSYTQLDSMLTRMAWKPQANPLKALLRLSPEYERLKQAIEATWAQHTPVKATRLEKVMTELNSSPYVFLVGASGVGKSHFVHNELAQRFEIVEGLDKLEQFVTPSAREKCLFIDEANLLHLNAMAIFNGLFHNPPQLLIKGQLMPLPEGHKVVFAGNFGHFKGRREIPFFTQHGHIITFKALPDEVLRAKVITPILTILFPKTATEDFKTMEEVFLKTYAKYGNTLSLTARNLEMMALRSHALSNKSSLNKTQIAALCAYDEIRLSLTKQERQDFFDWCETTFKLDKGFIKQSNQRFKAEITLENTSFFLTKSRKNPIYLLDVLMRIREEKMRDANLGQKGINAILIEGEPGIGKSLLAMAYLESKGFKHGKNNAMSQLNYYHLTLSAGLDVIKETLNKAFHQGAVVIIDELNTLPLEDLLNPMLSGVDANGHSAEKEGFTLIATQNPITYAKRQSLSTALLNRCQKIDLKNYPLTELAEIMMKLSADEQWALTKVNQFDGARTYANAKNLHPKPTPRHLFSVDF